jgi:hypothetical protein
VSLSLSRFCAQQMRVKPKKCTARVTPPNVPTNESLPTNPTIDLGFSLARLIDFPKLKPHSPARSETDYQPVISVGQRCAGLDVGGPRFTIIKEQ